jgi:hypothetical protein
METCGTEEPYEGKPHVRICGGAGWVTAGSTRTADCLQRPLRFRFRQRLRRSGRPRFPRSGKEVSQQQWSSAQERLHFLSTA